MLIPSPYKDYPPHWDVFDYYASVASPNYFNLFSSTGDINRFAARYRLAKCFRGMLLDSITEITANGYSALCRVLLVWSAFEFFLKAINVRQADLAGLLAPYHTQKWIDEIRRADTNEKFYRFIYERVNQSHKRELDNYFGNDPCNVTYLASAIRHLFAHGILTPNANGANPGDVITLCNVLYDALMSVMDDEFSKRMLEFRRMVTAP